MENGFVAWERRSAGRGRREGLPLDGVTNDGVRLAELLLVRRGRNLRSALKRLDELVNIDSPDFPVVPVLEPVSRSGRIP